MSETNGNGDAVKPGDIFKLITLVMNDITPIAKSRRNQQQGYQFRGIDDVYNELHPLLCKHNIFIVPFLVELKREERPTRDNKGVLFYTHAIIDHRFCAPDGSYITARTIGEAMDSGDKSSNKAQSAAMKYACIEVFAIPTEGDNDNENASPQPQPKQQQAPAQQPQQRQQNPAAPEKGVLASPEQINEVVGLLADREDAEALMNKWFGKANAKGWQDMPAYATVKCIEYLKKKQPAKAA